MTTVLQFSNIRVANSEPICQKKKAKLISTLHIILVGEAIQFNSVQLYLCSISNKERENTFTHAPSGSLRIYDPDRFY